jgi:hypothetical protein
LAPESAGVTCPADFYPWPTPLDSARGPEYLRWRGLDGVSSRFQMRPRLRPEKEFLSMTNAPQAPAGKGISFYDDATQEVFSIFFSFLLLPLPSL